MYTITVPQHHLLSHPSFKLPPSLFASHAFKFSANVQKSLFTENSDMWSPIRAVGGDGGQEDDARQKRVTVDSRGRSFSIDRAGRAISAQRYEERERVSSSMGETRSSGGGGERPALIKADAERSSLERGDRTSNSNYKFGPGFKPGFKGAERRPSFRSDSRDGSRGSFVRNVDSRAMGVRDGENFQPRDRKGSRRGRERTEAGSEGQEKVLNPRGLSWTNRSDDRRSGADPRKKTAGRNREEAERETYLRRLLKARLENVRLTSGSSSSRESEIAATDSIQENMGSLSRDNGIYRKRRSNCAVQKTPTISESMSEDEAALRKALKIRRKDTEQVLKEALRAGTLSESYSRNVVASMPGFVDHIMIQSVALKVEEKYVTSSFVARARVCVAQSKVVEIVKWMKHNHITVPRIGRLIDLKGEQFERLRQRISFLKENYVRGRDLGVVLTRQPIILDRPQKELDTLILLLKEAGVRREWMGFVISRSPRVLSLSIEDLQEKISFFKDLGVTVEQFGPMTFNFPASIGHFPLVEMQKNVVPARHAEGSCLDCRTTPWCLGLEYVDFFRRLGMIDSNIGRAIASRPQLLACSVDDALRPMCKYFQYLEIQIAGIQRILSLHPSVFCLNLEKNIAPKVRFLRAIGVREEVLGQVIVGFPALLTYSLDRKIRPVVRFLLERAGVTEEIVGKVIAMQPELLGCSIANKLEPIVKYFLNQQLRREQLGLMVADFPMLLKYNVHVIQPKYQYFKRGMDRSPADLVAFPRYFSYSLQGRIVPRQKIHKNEGLKFSLRYMLACSDELFAQRVDAALQGRTLDATEEAFIGVEASPSPNEEDAHDLNPTSGVDSEILDSTREEDNNDLDLMSEDDEDVCKYPQFKKSSANANGIDDSRFDIEEDEFLVKYCV